MSCERGIMSIYTSGMDVVVEWKIESFFNLPERDGVCYYSPDFLFVGVRWCLCIYPNGSSAYDTSGHVNLLLVKRDSDRCIKRSFSLSLKTATGEKYNEQFYTKYFKDWSEHIHDFHRFIRRSELTMRRSELVPDSVLTVVCTMESSTYAETARNTASCCHCKITFNANSLSLHQKKCMHRPVECPDCLEIVDFQTWLKEHAFQHECQQEIPEGNTASTSAECCHCKETFNADSLSSHQKKCMHRPVKCPDCLEVVVLQNWLDEHECQQERPEALIMTAKFMTVKGKKKAITAVNLQELKQKGLSKLDLSCSPDDLTVYLEDGTEIDEDDIYPAGRSFCKAKL